MTSHSLPHFELDIFVSRLKSAQSQDRLHPQTCAGLQPSSAKKGKSCCRRQNFRVLHPVLHTREQEGGILL